MRIKMKRLNPVLTLLLVAAATTITLARADIKFGKDAKFDFTLLKTFGWNAVSGEVKIWLTPDTSPNAAQTTPLLATALQPYVGDSWS